MDRLRAGVTRFRRIVAVFAPLIGAVTAQALCRERSGEHVVLSAVGFALVLVYCSNVAANLWLYNGRSRYRSLLMEVAQAGDLRGISHITRACAMVWGPRGTALQEQTLDMLLRVEDADAGWFDQETRQYLHAWSRALTRAYGLGVHGAQRELRPVLYAIGTIGGPSALRQLEALKQLAKQRNAHGIVAEVDTALLRLHRRLQQTEPHDV